MNKDEYDGMFSDAEICKSYRESGYSKKQIKVLSELCCTGTNEIVQILKANNCYVDPHSIKKTKSENLSEKSEDSKADSCLTKVEKSSKPESTHAKRVNFLTATRIRIIEREVRNGTPVQDVEKMLNVKEGYTGVYQKYWQISRALKTDAEYVKSPVKRLSETDAYELKKTMRLKMSDRFAINPDVRDTRDLRTSHAVDTTLDDMVEATKDDVLAELKRSEQKQKKLSEELHSLNVRIEVLKSLVTDVYKK